MTVDESLTEMIVSLEQLRFGRDTERMHAAAGQSAAHLAHYEQAVRFCEETLGTAMHVSGDGFDAEAIAQLRVRAQAAERLAGDRLAGMGHPDAQRFVSHLHGLVRTINQDLHAGERFPEDPAESFVRL